MKKQALLNFCNNCKFSVSYRYELFYSLNTLLDPNSRIHPKWRKTSLQELGGDFKKLLPEVGSSWELWPVLAALLPGPLPNPSFKEILEALAKMPIQIFQEEIFRGLIHSEEAVKLILDRKVALRLALAKVPKPKQEWISHIGLYPYDPESPQIVALEKLRLHPEKFRQNILRILELYWLKVFKKTWKRLLPQLQSSLQERERLFLSCSFSEFARQSLLRIEFDEKKDEIRALRGGYHLPLKDIQICHFMPSAFNDRRFWSALKNEEDRKNTAVFFPYFDPSISLDINLAGATANLDDPALDLALIFKALGDSTRFAIVSILARTPTSSVGLSKILSVSKPTISHHVHLLREAGLLQESYVDGSVELQIKRSVLECLSELVVERLFENKKSLKLVRSRAALAYPRGGHGTGQA
jgi:ArsR family transcriptional regulator